MGVWKQVTSQLAGIVKQTAKQVATEPLELGQSVVQQVTGDSTSADNKALSAMEQGQASAPSGGQAAGDPNAGGFKTQADYDRYMQLSGRKDEIELKQLRSQLHGQWAVETNLEQGMQRARMEREQKEQQEEQVEVQKKQEENWLKEKKKQEDVAVMAAKAQASGENKAWGAG